jgi:hypothetical protein
VLERVLHTVAGKGVKGRVAVAGNGVSVGGRAAHSGW